MRASALNIGDLCPGAPMLMAAKSVERDDLRDGTIAHEWIRMALEHGVDVARNWLGDYPMDGLETFWHWWKDVESSLPSISWSYETALSLLFGNKLVLDGHVDRLGRRPGAAIVIDWKYGKGQKYILSPIHDDLQMLAYACMAADLGEIEMVTVLRVRISDLEIDEIQYSKSQLDSGKELLKAIIEDIYENYDKRIPGHHCEHCLVTQHCMEWREQVEDVKSLMAVPGSVLMRHQATRWALARRAVKQAVADMDAALHDYITNGGIIEANGKRLYHVGGTKEHIADIAAAELVLVDEVGREEIQQIIKIKRQTSKSAIEQLLKDKGYNPKKRNEVFSKLREMGALRTFKVTPSLRWKKKNE